MAHMTVRTGYQQTVCVSLECYFHLSERQPTQRPPPPDTRERNSGGIHEERYTNSKKYSHFQWFLPT